MEILGGLASRLLPSFSPSPPTGPRLQIVSDLHLEVGQQYTSFTFPATAPFLLLSGDTGRIYDYEGYLTFLQAQAARYEKVFFLLGNHEFYEAEHEETIQRAQDLEKEPSLGGKVVLLHRKVWEYDGDDDSLQGFTIVGCTLWSALPESSRDVVQLAVSDFRHIKNWSAERHNDTHIEEAAWLREQITQLKTSDTRDKKSRQILIATHHAPCPKDTSNSSRVSSPWASAYATELISLRWPSSVKAWVFGHTHYSVDFVRNGIRVYANQRGYVLPNSTDEKREKEQLEGRVGRKPHGFDATASVQLW